jgi:[phosphatase 2A protein]-leucine-carboxy methyltransferase
MACVQRRQTGPHKNLIKSYIEIDFPEITTKKAMSIKKSKALSEILGKPDEIRLGETNV